MLIYGSVWAGKSAFCVPACSLCAYNNKPSHAWKRFTYCAMKILTRVKNLVKWCITCNSVVSGFLGGFSVQNCEKRTISFVMSVPSICCMSVCLSVRVEQLGSLRNIMKFIYSVFFQNLLNKFKFQ